MWKGSLVSFVKRDANTYIFSIFIFTNSEGFMNSTVFMKRLFPRSLKRPLMLVFDGYGSHDIQKIVTKKMSLKIVLTYLIQPSRFLLFVFNNTLL
jgi:hypothetical protein